MGNIASLLHTILRQFLPILGILVGVSSQISSVSNILVVDRSVEYTFGGQINFEARIESETPVADVFIFIKPEQETDAFVGTATVSTFDKVTYVYDLTERFIRPFSSIEYWYQVIHDDGEIYITPIYSFFYEDNHYEWRTLQDGDLSIHWYEGDLTYAQTILNAGQQGFQHIQEIIPLTALEGINIYVYAGSQEMQASLLLSGQPWIAGHAAPDLKVIVISLPPGPDEAYEAQRVIPHELMHVMLYHDLGQNYDNLPQWLNEGIASIAELYPNPDYLEILNQSYGEDSLIAIKELCNSFPIGAQSFLLAYAESTAFVNFLYQQFGSSGLQSLITQYADGVGCERGVELALEQTLDQLEHRWRSVMFNENPALMAIKGMLPWLIVFGVILIPPLILMIGKIKAKPVGA